MCQISFPIKKNYAPLYKRLRKKPIPSIDLNTNVVNHVKQKINSLPCLGIPNLSAYTIVETDASNIGYGGVLKQKLLGQE